MSAHIPGPYRLIETPNPYGEINYLLCADQIGIAHSQTHGGFSERQRATLELLRLAPELFDALASLVDGDCGYSSDGIRLPCDGIAGGMSRVERARQVLKQVRAGG